MCVSVQFMVNSARIRLKLDEQRIAELLQESSERNFAATNNRGGMSEAAANATAKILACLGDMGVASFTPGFSGATTHATCSLTAYGIACRGIGTADSCLQHRPCCSPCCMVGI